MSLFISKPEKYKMFEVQDLLVYKTQPCPNGLTCPGFIDRFVEKNCYTDDELGCPYFHDYKDKRRQITFKDKEFNYQGNYPRPSQTENLKFMAQNFFESLFHPVYYKNFSS